MASKVPSEFPVILEKDGAKRTAHSPIAYNQLQTQGFKLEGKAPAKKQADKPAEKSAEKPAEKADSKSADSKSTSK